jgi:hypothetical protein
MAYQIIPNLSYLGYQAYYKISDEKEPAAPIATATAVSNNDNLQSVAAYPVYEPINSNSNRYNNSSYRSSYIQESEIPGTINYSDGNHLIEVPYPTGPIIEKDIRLNFFQQNPTKIIYRRMRIGGDRFIPIGHIVSAQIVRGEHEYKFSNDTYSYKDISMLYYDPTSSGGNKRKSYRRRLVSAKRKSRKSRK